MNRGDHRSSFANQQQSDIFTLLAASFNGAENNPGELIDLYKPSIE